MRPLHHVLHFFGDAFRPIWSLIWLISLGLCASRAQAEESNLLDLSLEELVEYRLTSMSRKEQRVVDTAAAAYVITGEEIRLICAQDPELGKIESLKVFEKMLSHLSRKQTYHV